MYKNVGLENEGEYESCEGIFDEEKNRYETY